MIINFCYYAFYLCWYSIKYKGELDFIQYVVRNHILTPRLKYNMKTAYRRLAIQTINIIDNFL